MLSKDFSDDELAIYDKICDEALSVAIEYLHEQSDPFEKKVSAGLREKCYSLAANFRPKICAALITLTDPDISAIIDVVCCVTFQAISSNPYAGPVVGILSAKIASKGIMYYCRECV